MEGNTNVTVVTIRTLADNMGDYLYIHQTTVMCHEPTAILCTSTISTVDMLVFSHYCYCNAVFFFVHTV